MSYPFDHLGLFSMLFEEFVLLRSFLRILDDRVAVVVLVTSKVVLVIALLSPVIFFVRVQHGSSFLLLSVTARDEILGKQSRQSDLAPSNVQINHFNQLVLAGILRDRSSW